MILITKKKQSIADVAKILWHLILPFGLLITLLFSDGCSTTKWESTGLMNTARYRHTATLLRDGTVLVVGGLGDDDSVLPSVERYNPLTRSWSPAASMNIPRTGHTATRLTDGSVLVVGGITKNMHPAPMTSSAERYNPSANTWIPVKPMSASRVYHTAALLPDGTVLVVSGGPAGSGFGSQETAERYDPTSDTWTPAGNTRVPHTFGTATLLLDGTVLVAGGIAVDPEADDPRIYAMNYSERYNPANGLWSELAIMNETPFNHTATLLSDGTVLVAGGTATYNSVVRYDPLSSNGTDYQLDLWKYTADLSHHRSRHQATPLSDGTVLVTGGYYDCVYSGLGASCQSSLASVELYVPSPNSRLAGSWVSQDSMTYRRGGHTATPLPRDCKILVAGGFDWDSLGALNTAELFPAPCPRHIKILQPNF